MVTTPDDLYAVVHYGYCLAKLGMLDESLEAFNIALDIEPGNKAAQDCKSAVEDMINDRNASAAATASQHQYSMNAYNSLMGYMNMYSIFKTGKPVTMAQDFYSGSGLYDTSGTTSDAEKLLKKYQKWEKKIEKVYNFLSKQSGKGKNTSIDSDETNSEPALKQIFRFAKKEMERLRSNASENGVNLSKSKWESVNY